MRNEDNKSLLEAFCGVIYSAGGGGREELWGISNTAQFKSQL
jgi:hypothetical protein